ncbi:MAG TPA: bile acid:sodium symporter family protein [Aeromicrobium sp.]|nr:bile acid:sodium symporter family protein [Aeromicrobium sp.]
MRRFRPDPFIVALVAAAVIASVLPARGAAMDALDALTPVVIGMLFFLYGARLSTEETLSGVKHWRLHGVILATTYALFPLLGLASTLLEPAILTPGLASGVLLLCLVPSTVQSCVVYTRIAGGNVAAAVVSASMSNLLGVFLTPALVAWLMAADAAVDAGSVLRIVAQLLAPFVVGQLVRPWIGRWVERNDRPLRVYDRATIVLVVFVAFSKGTDAGLWSTTSVHDLVVVALVCAALLAIVMGWCVLVGQALGFSFEDRMPLLFCGSNKSLASGLPIASVLFPGPTVAFMVLPLMIYHQLQIITGSVVASRIARAHDV